jgi:hypothetical protein
MKSLASWNVLTALIWFLNGLWAKVLQRVPRHEAIVARILGGEHAREITKAIGFSEIGLGLWTATGLKKQQTAWLQIALIGTMNLLEGILARDLLLWGRWNALFAGILIGVVWWNAFGK